MYVCVCVCVCVGVSVCLSVNVFPRARLYELVNPSKRLGCWYDTENCASETYCTTTSVCVCVSVCLCVCVCRCGSVDVFL
jgi:hypothetical protein